MAITSEPRRIQQNKICRSNTCLVECNHGDLGPKQAQNSLQHDVNVQLSSKSNTVEHEMFATGKVREFAILATFGT